MNVEEVRALEKQRQEIFLRERTKRELEIKALFEEVERIKQLKPELLEGIELPNGTTAQELYPSLYNDSYDVEANKKEVAIVAEFVQKLQAALEPYHQQIYSLLKEGMAS